MCVRIERARRGDAATNDDGGGGGRAKRRRCCVLKSSDALALRVCVFVLDAPTNALPKLAAQSSFVSRAHHQSLPTHTNAPFFVVSTSPPARRACV